jgi:hypothetical protein
MPIELASLEALHALTASYLYLLTLIELVLND